MTRSKRRPRKKRSADEILAALKKTRRKYETGKKGKQRRAAWVDRNRDQVNAYKREWRKRRREQRLHERALAAF